MIGTPRLLLRPLRDEDVEPLWEIQGDRETMRFTYAAPSRDAPGWGPEVSYFLHPAHWGRGLATEVVRAAVAHRFEVLALPAIGAFARPDNAASIRVLEKCGFRLVRWERALGRSHYEVRRPALG